MQCVILAGGLGTRLRPITTTLPKALVPINGRPFAEYQLALLARQAITEIVYCIGHHGSQIADRIGNGSAFGLTVRYVEDGPELKGTGGALRRALDEGALAETFFVLYGDSYLPIAYPPVFAQFLTCDWAGLMTVIRNDNQWDRSNVIFAPPRVALYDKRAGKATQARMTHIDYGLSVLSRDLVADRISASTPSDLANLFHGLSLEGTLAGYEVAERFYEVGSPGGVADFAEYARAAGL